MTAEVRLGTTTCRSVGVINNQRSARSCPLWVKSRHVQRTNPCPLYPRKRTLRQLFDHLIGAVEQRWWDGETERLGGLEVDHKLEFARRLDRQISGTLPLEDSIDVRC